MNPSEYGPSPVELLPSPITVLVGHFGSGKTEIAANLAFRLRQQREAVTLIDLDVVKPYFRSRGLIEELEAAGVELVAPRDEFAHADLPIVVREVRGAIGKATTGSTRVIMDVGGADVGARVLGSIAGLADPRIADVLFVVNGNRPFAETPEAVMTMLREIEAVSKLRVQALVANTHLMDETTVEIVCEGIRLAEQVGRESGLQVRFCAVRSDLAAAVHEVVPQMPLFAVERHIMPALELKRLRTRRRSSLS